MDALLILVAVKAPPAGLFHRADGGAGFGRWKHRPVFGPFAMGAGYSSRASRRRANGSASKRWFNRYGMLTVFIPAVTPVLPLPLKVFVVFGGRVENPVQQVPRG